MKKITTFLLMLTAIIRIGFGQSQYGVDLAPAVPTTSSPGFVFGWPQYASQNFLYDAQYLNLYGSGYHGFDDGTSIPGGGINAYISSYFGVDIFTAGQRRLRINTNGRTIVDQDLLVNNGATISSDLPDTNPNSTWSSNLSVRNNNNSTNTFSRLTFVSASGGFGTITVKKTDTYTGDMYFQVRNGPGFYITPLLIKSNGRVGIGTDDPDAPLTVKGVIHTNEVRVDMNAPIQGPDYVFEKDYNLLSLKELETYINQNKHLPEVPSAKEMEANGLNLKEMNLILLKKVEELTLHLIEKEKKMTSMEKRIGQLEKQ